MSTRIEYLSAIAEDVIRVSKIDSAAFETTISELNSSGSFLDGDQATALIATQVSDQEAQSAIHRLIFAVHEWVNESRVEVAELGEELKAAWKECNGSSEIDEASFDKSLKALAGPFSGVERQANAVRVSNLAGNRASAISFVSDLRPVYRQPERDEVEGMIPLTTMVVDVSNPSGAESHLEVVLSISDLNKLIKEAQSAKNKIGQLIELAKSAGKEVPVLGLTKNLSAEDVR